MPKNVVPKVRVELTRVAPAGQSPEGLLLSLQAVAAEGEDKTAIEFCRLTASEIFGFQAPRGYE